MKDTDSTSQAFHKRGDMSGVSENVPLSFISIHEATWSAAGFKILFTADAKHYRFLWVLTSSFPISTTTQWLHWRSWSSFFHGSFKRKWNVKEASFTTANRPHLQFSVLWSLEEASLVSIIIFPIIYFSSHYIYILYFSDSLYYKLYVILY